MSDVIRRPWLLLLITAPLLAQAPAAGPLEAVRLSNERVRAILADSDAPGARTDGLLFDAVNAATDFALISRRVTDAFRVRMSASEYAEFDRTFQELLRKSSLRKLGRYRADRFEYESQEIRGDTALVRTLAFYEADRVRLDYHLERISGRWLIVNYVVDDVDTVRNYRKQFTRLFAGNDAAGVIARLKAKIEEIDRERLASRDDGGGRG